MMDGSVIETKPEFLIDGTTPLAEIDILEVGGKGLNLFRLRDAGMAVPRWLVVSSRLFDCVVGARRIVIEETLSAIDFDRPDEVEQAACRIRDLVVGCPLPEAFRAELLDALRTNDCAAKFAVRSSVVDEDSAAHSFAGQMDSLLDRRPSEVPDAIHDVWASAFSARALHYRHLKSIGISAISVAVIVQAMVPAAASGVLFTREPESRARRCVISAARGLGDVVTSGLANSDTYKIGWRSDDVTVTVPETSGETATPVSPGAGGRLTLDASRPQRVLDDGKVHRLRDAGIALEERFGAPQDIEWAFDDQGRCWYLQARPIVFATPPPHVRIWDNSNIVESYPGLTMPLSFSFARAAYNVTYRGAMRTFFPLKRSMVQRLDLFDEMIGLIEGRVYYNLMNWYAMLSFLPCFKGHKRAFDQMIGVAQEVDFAQTRLSALDRAWAGVVAIWRLSTLRRTAKKFFARFDQIFRRLEEVNLDTADEAQLMRIYWNDLGELGEAWHLTVENDFCAMVYYDWLRSLCRRWGPAEQPNLHNELLRQRTGIESVAPLSSVRRLADMFREHTRRDVLLGDMDDRDVYAAIQHDAAFKELARALDQHLSAFGDRSVQDLKFESPTFREWPDLLIGLIRDFVAAGCAAYTDAVDAAEPADHSEQTLRRYVRNPLKRVILRSVLANTRQAIANREAMRFARTRAIGQARCLFRRMGEHFAEKGLIERASDIHYLSVDEVFHYVRGTSVTRDLKALVEIRKADYAAFREQMPSDRIRTSGIPALGCIPDTPDHAACGAGRASGIGCASGIAEGVALVVRDPREAENAGGKILVAASTDPGWVFLMSVSKGIIVEKGSVLSHTAIIGRELGIPTVVAVNGATRSIPDGAHVVIDGATGEVRWR